VRVEVASRTGARSTSNINAIGRQPASLRSRQINALRAGWQPFGTKKAPPDRSDGAATITQGLKVQALPLNSLASAARRRARPGSTWPPALTQRVNSEAALSMRPALMCTSIVDRAKAPRPTL